MEENVIIPGVVFNGFENSWSGGRTKNGGLRTVVSKLAFAKSIVLDVSSLNSLLKLSPLLV